MLRHLVDPETGIVEIEIDGSADTESYRTLIHDMDAQIAARGKVSVLEIVRQIGWISPTVWWEDLGWSFRHLKDIDRAAVVTDMVWIQQLSKMMDAVMTADIAVFGLDEIDKAREWLTR